MTLPLPADKQGRIAAAAADLLVDAAAEADVVAMGPGLGRSPELTDLVDRLFRQVAAPMVVDADALNALADLPAGLPTPGGPRVLTPHPGEFRRLSGLPRLTPDEAPRVADQRAAVHGVVIVLKSHRTTVTDGVRRVVNTTGNPGMATGGSGDVLTGVIAGLIGQQHSPFDAAHLGVHLHGRAGDLAAAELGETSLIASDLLRWLPAAFREHAGRCQTPPPEE